MTSQPTPTERLAELARHVREGIDVGRLPASRGRFRLAAHCQQLVATFPHDAELWRSVETLSVADFIPPRPHRLPRGSSRAIAVELSAHKAASLQTMAASVLALPSAVTEPDRARAVLELLLLAEDGTQRAERLIEALQVSATDAEYALWRLQVALKEAPLDQGEQTSTNRDGIETLLDHLREADDDLLLRDGLLMVISARLDQAPVYGRAWIETALGGRHIAGVALALRRRPALSDELPGLTSLLDEASALALSDPRQSVLEQALNRVALAEAEGRLTPLRQELQSLIEFGSDREDVAACITALGFGLGDGSHSTPAELMLRAPDVASPSPPESGWSSRLSDLAGADRMHSEDLALLEATQATSRAAEAWLRLAETDEQALLQAWRLNESLAPSSRERLKHLLEQRVGDDEVMMGEDCPEFALSLWHFLPDGAQRDLLGLRIHAVHPDAVLDYSGETDDDVESLDPHSTRSRLASAESLLEAERHQACAAIISSLLRRRDNAKHDAEIVSMTCVLLSMEEPLDGLPAAVSKAMLAANEFGGRLLKALAESPLAAFPLHVELHHAAADKRRHDAQRMLSLRAWLGIWAATETSPESGGLQGLMRADALLLPLAAAQLGHADDPISRALRFREHFPADSTTPKAFGRALLSLAAGGTPWS